MSESKIRELPVAPDIDVDFDTVLPVMRDCGDVYKKIPIHVLAKTLRDCLGDEFEMIEGCDGRVRFRRADQ